jgi:hypothetical protein
MAPEDDHAILRRISASHKTADSAHTEEGKPASMAEFKKQEQKKGSKSVRALSRVYTKK